MFSIIIPTCNRTEMLRRCLQQLRNQGAVSDPALCEVIVTDDGECDDTKAALQDEFPFVRYVQGPRMGPAANRNYGASCARGEWLLFTDDDCIPLPDWLDSFRAALESSVRVYEGKTICNETARSPFEHAPVNLEGGYLWSCNLLIDAKLFASFGGFDEMFRFPHLEDVDLRERLRDAGIDTRFVPAAMVEHPLRRLPWGAALGKLHESEVYYWRQKRGDRFRPVRLLGDILAARAKTLIRCFPSYDTPSAVASLAVELVYVVSHLRLWYYRYPCVERSR